MTTFAKAACALILVAPPAASAGNEAADYALGHRAQALTIGRAAGTAPELLRLTISVPGETIYLESTQREDEGAFKTGQRYLAVPQAEQALAEISDIVGEKGLIHSSPRNNIEALETGARVTTYLNIHVLVAVGALPHLETEFWKKVFDGMTQFGHVSASIVHLSDFPQEPAADQPY